MATAPGAALVHCAAGKDRTGVVVALALSAVGVRPDAVAADYAATGERLELLLARLRRSPTYARDVNSKPAGSHRPQASTMAAFLDQLTARYGGASRVAGRARLRPGRPGPAAGQAAPGLTAAGGYLSSSRAITSCWIWLVPS